MGPVPLELMQEWEELEADIAIAISIVPEWVIDFIRERVVPKVAFDDSLFTRRELRLMHDLSTNFADELTNSLTGFTHEERRPWDKICDGSCHARALLVRTLCSCSRVEQQPSLFSSQSGVHSRRKQLPRPQID